jgi:uncharacterized phage protein (TIGR01671 family)
MRDIKFRGKRVDNGEWVYGTYHYAADNSIHYILARERFLNRVDDKEYSLHHKEVWQVCSSTVGQYTELKDDSDREIYDGDIVVNIFGDMAAIEWNDDTCKFQFSDGTDINDNGRYGTYRVVIGNIHDNPELLNNKQ